MEAFEIFSQGEIWRVVVVFLGRTFLEKPEDMSDFEPDTRARVRVVPDVTDVPVSPSSVVTEFCDGFSFCSDWEFVEPQSFSFSKKRAHVCTATQEEMRYESSPAQAPLPSSSRRMEAHTTAKV